MKKAKILSALMAIAITATPTLGNEISNFSKSKNQLIAHAVDGKQTGWELHNGWWYYYKDGKYVTDWEEIDGKWYLFGWDGRMITHWYRRLGVCYYFGEDGASREGWVRIKNDSHFDGDYNDPYDYGERHKNYDEWFYFNKSGQMLTGWQEIDGQKYFFVPDHIWVSKNKCLGFEDLLKDKPEGYMYHGMLEYNGETFYLDKNGAMCTGWKKIGDDWYYFSEEGVMKTGDWLDDRYYFDENGKMLTGEHTIDGNKYVFSSDGYLLKGWKKVGDTWYYYDSNCEIVKGKSQNIDGKLYYFSDDGKMLTGWQKMFNGISDKWYYLGSDGAMRTGWQKINNNYYYFDTNGEMLIGKQTIDGDECTFDDNGKLLVSYTGWKQQNGKWYYYNSYGLKHKGWLEYNGSRYYFLKNGEMVHDAGIHIDGYMCYFDSKGVYIRSVFDDPGVAHAPDQEYYDVNGTKYRHGNSLLPNTQFESRGYQYETDERGRIISVEGTLRLKEDGYIRNMENVRNFEGQEYNEDDQRGHLIAHQFNGSDRLENLVPMSADANNLKFKKLEDDLAGDVDHGAVVWLKIEPEYEGASSRPTNFHITYRINGIEETDDIPN